MKKLFIYCILLFAFIHSMNGQEYTAPLLGNAALQVSEYRTSSFAKRSTPILLPLFEDFHSVDTSKYPIDFWWIDSSVYINNHFSTNHNNKGIATFDVIDKYGRAYHSDNPFASIFCDSLTSYSINLSDKSVADSIYLSFEYLTKGLGFQPKPADSLLIFFNDSVNGWRRAGFIIPDTTSHWRTKMIKLEGGQYFYSNFQFRIINRGSIGTSSSHWHIDNVYMNAGRSIIDTQITDVAFTTPPTNLLNDFTAMPFRHYNTARSSFTASDFKVNQLNKNYVGITQSGTVYYNARNKNTGALYGTNNTTYMLPALLPVQVSVPMYNVSGLTADPSGNLTVTHTFYFDPVSGDTLRYNDSIVHNQVFGNYFAYDDGSAEQSYYLNLAPSTPGKIAIEYATYVTDTIAGVAIQFAPQVPTNEYKEFFIQIYRSIEIGGNGGELIYSEEGFYPRVPTTANEYYTYPLNNPVPLGTGIYYIVIMMPASGISDSLMIGLDMNRVGGNHRYYNVLDVWESSLLEGASMIRPIMGGQKLTAVPQIADNTPHMHIFPNPTTSDLHIEIEKSHDIKNAVFRIIDINGSTLLIGDWEKGKGINVQSLASGQYILQLITRDGSYLNNKFIKN